MTMSYMKKHLMTKIDTIWSLQRRAIYYRV